MDEEPALLGYKSNPGLLSRMAVKIASLHLLAESGSPLLRTNIINARSHLNSLYERLLDDPRIKQDAHAAIMDRLRKKSRQESPAE